MLKFCIGLQGAGLDSKSSQQIKTKKIQYFSQINYFLLNFMDHIKFFVRGKAYSRDIFNTKKNQSGALSTVLDSRFDNHVVRLEIATGKKYELVSTNFFIQLGILKKFVLIFCEHTKFPEFPEGYKVFDIVLYEDFGLKQFKVEDLASDIFWGCRLDVLSRLGNFCIGVFMGNCSSILGEIQYKTKNVHASLLIGAETDRDKRLVKLQLLYWESVKLMYATNQTENYLVSISLNVTNLVFNIFKARNFIRAFIDLMRILKMFLIFQTFLEKIFIGVAFLFGPFLIKIFTTVDGKIMVDFYFDYKKELTQNLFFQNNPIHA